MKSKLEVKSMSGSVLLSRSWILPQSRGRNP
jgi:hypothetical protein